MKIITYIISWIIVQSTSIEKNEYGLVTSQTSSFIRTESLQTKEISNRDSALIFIGKLKAQKDIRSIRLDSLQELSPFMYLEKPNYLIISN